MTTDPPSATTPEQEEAIRKLRVASARVRRHEREREELAVAIVGALRAEVRPSKIAEIAPYDRNHVRRIGRAAGIPPRPKAKSTTA